jgi:hypothetical protein
MLETIIMLDDMSFRSEVDPGHCLFINLILSYLFLQEQL